MNIRKAILLLATVFASMLPSNSFAECIPGNDPCAPKKVIDAWDKSLAFGFNLTSGNSETTLLNIGARAVRESAIDIWDFSMNYNYGEDKNTVDEDGNDTTRNDFRAAGQYDYFLSDRTYIGFGTKFLYDEIADIDYRVTPDPKVGYYLLKDNTFKLRAEAGPSYIFEKVGGLSNDYLAPRVAERFEWALTCTSKIFQSVEAYFDVNDSENYIVNAEVGAEAALATNLSLVFTVRDTYDNQPAEGKEKDDLSVITAIKVAL